MDRSTLRLRTIGIRRFLPTGRVLEELDFAARHRLLTTILALHIPVLIRTCLRLLKVRSKASE